MNESLEDVIIEAFTALSAQQRFCVPGFILSREGRMVTCQSSIPFRKTNPDTQEIEAYQPDPISNVPLFIFEGGGCASTYPIVAGQRCLLIMSDRALDSWKAGATGPPLDLRRFDLSDAFCLPGGRPPADPLPDEAFSEGNRVEYLPGAAKMKVGSASASDPVALSSLVDANFSAVAAALNVFVTAWNAALPAGPVTATGATLAPVSTSGTGSTKLETE